MAVPTVAIGLLAAVGLEAAFDRGWFHTPLATLAATAPMTVVAYLAVLVSHCRNRRVAACYAAVAGGVVYLGYFYVGFLNEADGQAKCGLDRFARFVTERVSGQPVWLEELPEEEDAAEGVAVLRPMSARWLFFALDGLILAGLPALVAALKAGQPYCETCHGWLSTRKLYGDTDKGFRVAAVIESGTLDNLPKVHLVQQAHQVKSDLDYAVFRLEFCAPDNVGRACGCTYFTVTNVRWAIPFTLLRRLRIQPTELVALAEKMTGFRSVANLVGRRPANQWSLGIPQADKAPTALVEEVPSLWAPRVLTIWTGAVKLVLANISAIGLIAGIVMLVVGWRRGVWKVALHAWQSPGVILWLGGGALLLLAGITLACLNEEILSHRFNRWMARRRIRCHLDKVVDPNDPDALYVHLVPRAHWEQLAPDRPSEVGFLRVDVHRGELRFEGSKWRYRIPGEVITSCAVEPIEPAPGWAISHATVVCARVFDGTSVDQATDSTPVTLELPFVQPPMTLINSPRRRQATAEKLLDKIRAIALPDDTDAT